MLDSGTAVLVECEIPEDHRFAPVAEDIDNLAFGIVGLVGLGWLIGELDTLGKLPPLFKTAKTYATTDEITCLNEWVLRLAGENSETAADQTRAKLLNDYATFGHVNSQNGLL